MSVGTLKTRSEAKTMVKASSLIHPQCLELLQKRNHEEEMSARLYEEMYMFLDNIGFVNLGNLWHNYAHEEMLHADWAREYMLNLGIQPELREMPKLNCEYKGLVDVIKKSYKHEIEITEQCKELAASAMAHGDHMLYELALKYLKEQIEEVGKMQTWMDKLETFGTSIDALHRLEIAAGE